MTEMLDERLDLRLDRHEPTPVRVGRREIGAYVSGPGRTVFVPAVDVTAIVAAGAAVLIAVAAAAGFARRRTPSIGAVTMGPGGWVSLRNSTAPALRAAPAPGRPWWARALRARRLVLDGHCSRGTGSPSARTTRRYQGSSS